MTDILTTSAVTITILLIGDHLLIFRKGDDFVQPLHMDPPVVPPMEAVSVAQPTDTRSLNIW